MTQELLELWVTRLTGPPAADDTQQLPDLEARIRDRNRNLVLIGDDIAKCQRQLRRSLHDVAWADARTDDQDQDVTGWLAIAVPVPNQVPPTELMHRMLRRLYFAAVLHGLAEMESLRDAVQSLRLSFLQTRGKVTTSESQSRREKEGAEVSATLSLLKPSLSGKLTAEEEVTVAEQLSAEMQRLDLMESEDQLLYDLQILTQLRLDINSYTKQIGEEKVPRWERVRRFFKAVYSPWKSRRFYLRPVFIFVAHSIDTVAALLTFLSKAASLASAEGGKIIIVGSSQLAAAYDADASLGHPILRHSFDREDLDPPVAATSIQGFLESASKTLPPDVLAVLKASASPPAHDRGS